MSKLLQPLLLGLIVLLFSVWQQYRLERTSTELARVEANAVLLLDAIEQQNISITRLQREKQQAERLLKTQRLELQQLATDTRNKHHAVQHHLAKAVPGRPDCNRERLPAAVIGLLGSSRDDSETADADITATGVNSSMP